MATWHQRKSRVKLYDATQWSVVEERPNGRGCMLFNTREAAEDYRAAVSKHRPVSTVYILNPRGE